MCVRMNRKNDFENRINMKMQRENILLSILEM